MTPSGAIAAASVLLLAATLFLFWLETRDRRAEMKALADLFKLEYLGRKLPLEAAEFGCKKTWGITHINVLRGKLCGRQVIVFDESLTGRYSTRRRTVLAIKANRDFFLHGARKAKLQDPQSRLWKVLCLKPEWYGSRFATAHELAAWLEAMNHEQAE